MATTEHAQDDRRASHASSIDDEKTHIQSQEREAGEEPTPEEVEFRRRELKVVTKLDVYIVPVLLILQLLSFLDRGSYSQPAQTSTTKSIR